MSCRSHSGRGGQTRTFWLLLPYFSLRASARLGPPSRQGQDLASRPTLDNGGGSALRCTSARTFQADPPPVSLSLGTVMPSFTSSA